MATIVQHPPSSAVLISAWRVFADPVCGSRSQSAGSSSFELAFGVDGCDGFANSHGEPVSGVAARDGRATSAVGQQGETVAAMSHDPELNNAPEFSSSRERRDTPRLENGRLEHELTAARVRAVVAGDEVRRKVERDLHDGAQQQIVALQIRVALARGDAEFPRV